MTSIYKSRISWTSLSKYQKVNDWWNEIYVCLLQENEINYSTQSCTCMFTVKNNHQASRASSFANTSQKQKSRINRGPTSILQQPLLLATDWPPASLTDHRPTNCVCPPLFTVVAPPNFITGVRRFEHMTPVLRNLH